MLNLEKDNCCWATTTLLWANDGIVQLFFLFIPTLVLPLLCQLGRVGGAGGYELGESWGVGGGVEIEACNLRCVV